MSLKWFQSRFDGSQNLDLPFLMPGDMVIHFRAPLFGDPTVLDFWIMKGGERLAITSKVADLPPGFELHPTEAFNALALTMMVRIERGWTPGEIMTAGNIWRVCPGDRLALIGERAEQQSGLFLGMFDITVCALVYWVNIDDEMPVPEESMGVPPDENDERRLEWMRLALAKVKSMGVPRAIGAKWGLG